jgi:hypothetical protein
METRLDYANRMRRVRPFQFFGIEPQWNPEERGDIEGFVHDEVVRQFHDTRVWDDGGKRIEYMLDAWYYAQGEAHNLPTLEDILKLGAKVEPSYNATRNRPDGVFRNENVYIGTRMGVYPSYLHHCVELLVSKAADVDTGKSRGYANGKTLPDILQVEDFKEQLDLIETVDDWYLAYEWIHPFADGNGRTGKVLHNWLGGTLDDPVLVPDYFGGGNP